MSYGGYSSLTLLLGTYLGLREVKKFATTNYVDQPWRPFIV